MVLAKYVVLFYYNINAHINILQFSSILFYTLVQLHKRIDEFYRVMVIYIFYLN